VTALKDGIFSFKNLKFKKTMLNNSSTTIGSFSSLNDAICDIKARGHNPVEITDSKFIADWLKRDADFWSDPRKGIVYSPPKGYIVPRFFFERRKYWEVYTYPDGSLDYLGDGRE
jgi:hypothetical protein